jgi:hypothetical protein
MRPALEGTSGEGVVTLAKYYTVTGAEKKDYNPIMADLQAHEDVQFAYLMPYPELPVPIITMDTTNQTLNRTNISADLTGRQNYLFSGSQGGIGAHFAMNQSGGLGGKWTM